MAFDIAPVTEAGQRYMDLIEGHAETFAERAAEHDSAGQFVRANVEDMQRSGAMAATVPEALGGGGLMSIHDLAMGQLRLAMACGSTAISTYMHLTSAQTAGRAWSAMVARGRREAMAAQEALLQGIAAGRDVLAVAGTEPGTNAARYPNTTGERAEGGWVLNGMKTFATMSPAATVLFTLFRAVTEDEEDHAGTAFVSVDTPGVEILDDWNGLGMRGSGSGRVRFTDCLVPTEAVAVGLPLGEATVSSLYNSVGANTGLVSCGLGIAKAARDTAVAHLLRARKAPSNRLLAERSGNQLALAEIDVNLDAAIAMQRQNTAEIDQLLDTRSPREIELGEMRALDAATQATKVFCDRVSVRTVDQAMQLTSGSGYVATTDMARYYRDVRAVPFMAPQATDSLLYIGQVALGFEPTPED